MTASKIDHVTDLLNRTKEAHGDYERTALNGVYDQEWAAWYGEKALDFGLNQLLGANYEAKALGQRLAALYEDMKQSNPGADWAAYTASRLVEG